MRGNPMELPDPVPLDVSGQITLPLAAFLAARDIHGGPDEVLLTDEERIAYLAQALWRAVDRPLTSPGSEVFAKKVLECFPGVDLMEGFAEKALETLRDGKSHNRTAISTRAPHVGVLFVAWNGTHREVQPERYGHYLQPLLATAHGLVQRGIPLAGLLEIDAYLRESADASQPTRPLEQVFAVDLEYSYVPGFLVGADASAAHPLPSMLMLNPDLCTEEERQLLAVAQANARHS